MLVKLGIKDASANADADILVKQLKDSFRSRIRVAPRVEVLPVDVIRAINFPAKSRKPIKFIDLR